MTQKKLKIILNPYAGRWKAKAHIETIKTTLAKFGIAFDLVVTQAPKDGQTLALEASLAGYERVVAVGGDGIISEVAGGLVQAAKDGQAGDLGIIPLGTANDLATMLEIPQDIQAACEKIVTGHTRAIDVGQVNNHLFDNNSAVGLESVVTVEAEKISYIRGPIRYLIAALLTIAKKPTWHAHIEWDEGSYDGPITLVSVGNSPRTGGAFWMTPQAEVDNGKLDIVFAPALSRLQMLTLLPKTFRGTHINHKAVTTLRITSLQIRMEPTPIQADGELIDHQATRINYTVLPQKLRVIV